MQPERLGEVLQAIEEYCRGIIALKGRPSDDMIDVCEKVLEIIENKLKK